LYVSHISGAAFTEYRTCYELNYQQKRALGLLPVSHESITIENDARGLVVVGGYSVLGKEQIKDLQASHPEIEVTQLTYQLRGAMSLLAAPTERFQIALAYASQAHASHCRKGTTIPYISHPLAVASIVLEHGGDEDEVISAMLHDVVEDAGGEWRLDDIRAKFGDRVAEIVEACSDAYGDQAAGIPKGPWKERKEHHLERLQGAGPSVALVTAADKLHNMYALIRDYNSIGEQLWSRFNAGPKDIIWYYRAVAQVLAELHASALIEELKRAVAELEKLADENGEAGIDNHQARASGRDSDNGIASDSPV
jgi:GTP pyrophosphokinase